ncbi:hypothetical protein PIB30_070693 [Stylosanthes scabra]|uniref:Uncharacterized protein n=1 Tax=Stylosanthes scabra TaxID=79078 RepID=A0ABU6URC8_9FABA|nr:hypothetical protein [Stylosanthes scabra]
MALPPFLCFMPSLLFFIILSKSASPPSPNVVQHRRILPVFQPRVVVGPTSCHSLALPVQLQAPSTSLDVLLCRCPTPACGPPRCHYSYLMATNSPVGIAMGTHEGEDMPPFPVPRPRPLNP